MRRLILFVFSISTAFSGMCTMAYAQTNDTSMSHVAACEAVGRHDATGMCGEKGENAAPMFHAQSPCTDGSCFVRSTTQGSDTLLSSVLVLLNAASLPPTLDEPLWSDRVAEFAMIQAVDQPPPDILSSVVLRE